LDIKLKLKSSGFPNWTWYTLDNVRNIYIGKRKTIIRYYVKFPWSPIRLAFKTKDVLSIEVI